jgi:CubicO group peptidase (beta-lactamase class C family)
VFQLASMSKPVGATVISRAVSKGVVAWDDPVNKYLPWFRIGDDYVSKHVTLEDLYSHRSGLPDHAGDLLEDLGFERKQILKRLRLLPFGPFRAQYAYTNFGLTAAAEAVARAFHTTWEDLSQDLLYQPAGMFHTSSRYDDYISAANHATTHQRNSSGEWFPGPPRDPDPQSPAGGVSSTANDMARWMQLQLGNGELDEVELIKPDIIQVMRQPRSFDSLSADPQARPSTYCLGLLLKADGTGNAVWSHSGAFLLGAATALTMIPAGDIGITVLTNGEPHGIPEAIAAEFVDIVETGELQRDWLSLYQQAFAPFYANPSELAGKDPPSYPVPSEPLSHYAGNYRNDYYGKARLTVNDDGLAMALGPEPQYYRLQHWDGNVFAYYPKGENALGITAVTFDQIRKTVTVENLDENGLGTFTMANRHTRQ